MPRKKSDVVYIVIWVHSGVVYAVEAHRAKKTAQARKRFFKKDTNPEYDDVSVVEVEIGARSEE